MPTEDLLATPTLTHKDMPFVMFDTKPVEDAAKTKAEGQMRYRDQDYAIVTVPGDSKSNSIEKIESFFRKKEEEMKVGRVHPDWIRKWRHDYDLYRKGQEIPLDGTPIKGWKLLSGAQQEDLIRLHIRTVEELANLSDDGMRNYGMGALELKRRAQAWLSQNQTHEAGALKLAELTRENDSLKDQVATLVTNVQELEKALAKKGKAA